MKYENMPREELIAELKAWEGKFAEKVEERVKEVTEREMDRLSERIDYYSRAVDIYIKESLDQDLNQLKGRVEGAVSFFNRWGVDVAFNQLNKALREAHIDWKRLNSL
jgi:hypothetical protein